MIIPDSNCIGCGACKSECPVNCISIIRKDGQYTPLVDKNKCLNCRKCESVCVALQAVRLDYSSEHSAYFGFANNEQERIVSSSGGVFYAIAKAFLKDGGIVVGAAYDSEFNVRHKIVNSVSDLHKIRGSKYVESDLSPVFSEIKAYLDEGKRVLFSGVPCQVGAIKVFLGKKYDNLYTCEVFCHGAPRSGIFDAYKSLITKKNGPITGFNFRSKYYGWSNPVYEIVTQEKRIIEKHKDNIYHLMFGYHVSLRDSCYECQFRKHERVADLSLGDFWGIEKYYPDVQTKNGVSAIIVNTNKGQRLLDKTTIWLTPCKTEEIYDKNTWMIMNYEKPDEQKSFIKDFTHMDYYLFFRKYKYKYKIFNRIKRIVRRIVK